MPVFLALACHARREGAFTGTKKLHPIGLGHRGRGRGEKDKEKTSDEYLASG